MRIESTIASFAPTSSLPNLGINIPGVSSNKYLLQLIHCSDFVIPGILPTLATLELAKALIKVLLPMLGIPNTTHFNGGVNLFFNLFFSSNNL